MRVLIADDDPVSRRVLERALKKWGYDVTSVCDGAQAWETICADPPVMVAILDWLMPKLDGIEVCRRARQQLTHPPYLLLLTAKTGTTNILEGFEAGADEFVVKPCNLAELQARVKVGARVKSLQASLAERVAALEAAERRYRDLVEDLDVVVWEADGAFEFVFMSRMALDLFGRSAEAYMSDPRLWMQQVVPADRPRVEQYRDAVLGGFHTVDCEYRVHLPNGQMRWVRDMARNTSSPGDPERRIRGVTMDVTTEHEASDQLQAAVKMQSDFVSFASHQLRTPLTGINWMLELAASEPVDSPDLPGFIKDALDSSQRLVGLVNDLLGISRLESGRLVVNPESIELAGMAQEIASDLAPLVAKQEHRVDLSGVEGPACVFADRQLLKQALANLCSNAIKYTPRGGDITVRVTAGDVVRFEVQDSGIGVPESARSRLFGKFFRAENVTTVETEGTGLGLYIVRLIVERSGGEVWYEPAEPRGSRFIVQLPAELPLDDTLYDTPPAEMPSETGASDD